MDVLFGSDPIDGAELTSRCCNRKPLRLQFKADYEDRTLYVCVDCGAEYSLKPNYKRIRKPSDAPSS
jgi:hypothetical protein